jgi:hypothetical protein
VAFSTTATLGLTFLLLAAATGGRKLKFAPLKE